MFINTLIILGIIIIVVLGVIRLILGHGGKTRSLTYFFPIIMGLIFGGITFVIYTRMKNDGAEDANMMLFLSIFIFIGIISMIYLKSVGEKQGIQQIYLEMPRFLPRTCIGTKCLFPII